MALSRWRLSQAVLAIQVVMHDKGSVQSKNFMVQITKLFFAMVASILDDRHVCWRKPIIDLINRTFDHSQISQSLTGLICCTHEVVFGADTFGMSMRPAGTASNNALQPRSSLVEMSAQLQKQLPVRQCFCLDRNVL